MLRFIKKRAMSQTPQRHRKSLLKPARRISGIPSAATLAWINSKSNLQSNLSNAPTLPNLNSNGQSVVRKITFSHNENDNGNASFAYPKVQSTNEVMNNINNKLKKRHSLGPNFLNNSKADQTPSLKKRGKKFATLPKQNRKMITVHIDSLWSESESNDEIDTNIELAMLALLDDDNHVIPISNIATIPDCDNLEDLDKLLNMSYDKGDQIFKGKYNTKTRLSFVLSIDDSFSAKTLRIWNPDSKTDFSVKDISVYEGSMLVAQGSVPQQFGMNLPLIQNDYVNPDIHPKINVYYDKYGIMPTKQVRHVQIYFTETYCKEKDFKKEIIKEIEREKSQQKESPEDDDKTAREPEELVASVSTLSVPPLDIYEQISEQYDIEIKHKKRSNSANSAIQFKLHDGRQENDVLPQKIEMYDNQPLRFGLNGIDFIDFTGQLLNENDIEEVEIYGLINVSNYDKLFRQKKDTDDEDEMFSGEVLEGKIPFLDIKFKEPQYLTKILIWNYNVNGDCLSFGAKAAKVYFDSKLSWYGKIPMGVGNVHNIIYSIRQIPVNQYFEPKTLKNKDL